jgi:hypothetical protein
MSGRPDKAVIRMEPAYSKSVAKRMLATLTPLREIESKATPAPWYATDAAYGIKTLVAHKIGKSGKDYGSRPDYDTIQDEYPFRDEEELTVSASPDAPGWENDGGHEGYGIRRPDAELIAAMRNTYTLMLDEIERLRARVAELEGTDVK